MTVPRRPAVAGAPARLVTGALLVLCASPLACGGEPQEAEAAERVRALIQQLKDKDASVRMKAASALGQIGQAAVPALTEALRDEDGRLRCGAADALGRIGPPAKEAVPALARALGDPDPELRRGAVYALRGIGPAAGEAVPALVRALGESGFDVYAATTALQKIGAAAVPALLQASRSPDKDVRRTALFALRHIRPVPDEALPLFIQALSDEDPRVREQAARALSWIGPPAGAVPDLVGALNDDDWEVRRAAASALAKSGSAAKEAVPALIAALQDENGSVRESAAEALGEIGPVTDEVVPALVLMLESRNKYRQVLAAEALGEIGTPAKEAVPALVRLALKSGYRHYLRYGDNAAADALGRIDPAERERIHPAYEIRPWETTACAHRSSREEKTTLHLGVRLQDYGVEWLRAEAGLLEDGAVPRFHVGGAVFVGGAPDGPFLAIPLELRRNLRLDEERVWSIGPLWGVNPEIVPVIGYKRVDYASADTFRGVRLSMSSPVDTVLVGYKRVGTALAAGGAADICVGRSSGFALQSDMEGYVELRYTRPAERTSLRAAVRAGVEAAWDSGNDTLASDPYVRAAVTLAF